ncbi:hypothetical protein SAMN05444172_9234 [Burkholderia sp. GAS332]|nr:hypothetical protein SAMN05444172_9234 [Burkholderia sp. GAS332]
MTGHLIRWPTFREVFEQIAAMHGEGISVPIVEQNVGQPSTSPILRVCSMTGGLPSLAQSVNSEAAKHGRPRYRVQTLRIRLLRAQAPGTTLDSIRASVLHRSPKFVKTQRINRYIAAGSLCSPWRAKRDKALVQ